MKPALNLAPDGDHEAQRRLAVLWVDRNMRKIRGRAAKFQRYSPYDLEDFIQQSYIAALAAVDVSRDQDLPFEACFWVLFTAESRIMASNPVTRNRYEEFTEDYTEQGYAPTFTQELYQPPTGELSSREDLEMIQGIIDMALSVMTPRQREVWRFLLSDKHHTTAEIAEILGVKRQVVEELRESGLTRVRKHFGGRP